MPISRYEDAGRNRNLKGRLRAVSRCRSTWFCGQGQDPCAVDGGRRSLRSAPSVCRMALSQSRAACDACLQMAGGSIPYIEQPRRSPRSCNGIDHASHVRTYRPKQLVLSRAPVDRARRCEGREDLAAGKDLLRAPISAPLWPIQPRHSAAAARRPESPDLLLSNLIVRPWDAPPGRGGSGPRWRDGT